jgi:DNA replication protein DnaC
MSTTTSVTPLLRRRRPMTDEAAAAATDSALRRLRLPTMRAVLGDAVTAAEKGQLSYIGFLAELLLAEVDDRDRRSTIRRVASAGFPRPKFLDDIDYDANGHLNAATINTLAQGDWVRRGDPLCLIGDSGTGKSHLLIGLGTAAAEKGFRVRYTLATRLVNELVEAADELQLARTIARYGRVDLLIIDELGYMELDKRGAELLFQVLTEREEKPPSRSPRTSPSANGPERSPTPDFAPRSSTGSRSTAPSSRPAPTPTASPTPAKQIRRLNVRPAETGQADDVVSGRVPAGADWETSVQTSVISRISPSRTRTNVAHSKWSRPSRPCPVTCERQAARSESPTISSTRRCSNPGYSAFNLIQDSRSKVSSVWTYRQEKSS